VIAEQFAFYYERFTVPVAGSSSPSGASGS